LCCYCFGTRVYAPARAVARYVRPSADLPVSFGHISYLPASPPLDFYAGWDKHLAAVRLRPYNFLIKQGISEHRRRCVNQAKGAQAGACGGMRLPAGTRRDRPLASATPKAECV
jgi:hypothetical protein